MRRSAAYYGLALQAFQRNNLDDAERQLGLAAADGRESAQMAKLSVDIALARKDNRRALDLAQAATKRWPEPRALGVAYGIWGALGVATTAVMSSLIFDETLTALMGVGIVLIIAGVLTVELGSQAAHKNAHTKESI